MTTTSKPTKVIKLSFDPVAKLPLVWGDWYARMIYLLWAPGHLIGETFAADCLWIGQRIEERNPKTAEELGQCFPVNQGDGSFTRYDVDQFCAEAIEYVLGNRVVTWQEPGMQGVDDLNRRLLGQEDLGRGMTADDMFVEAQKAREAGFANAARALEIMTRELLTQKRKEREGNHAGGGR